MTRLRYRAKSRLQIRSGNEEMVGVPKAAPAALRLDIVGNGSLRADDGEFCVGACDTDERAALGPRWSWRVGFQLCDGEKLGEQFKY